MNLSSWKTRWSRDRRAWLAGGLSVVAGLAFWATAQTQEDGSGVPVPDPAPMSDAQRPSAPSLAIDFPRRSAQPGVSPALFKGHSWYVPPPPPPPVKAGPPPKPMAPPLPFVLLGSYEPAGGRAVFYLVRGEQVFDVKVGDTLEGTYSIDAVQNEELLFTYLPLKQQQSLSLRR